MDLKNPVIKRWINVLKTRTPDDLEYPQTRRMPIIYNTREKRYEYNPLGILIKVYMEMNPNEYEIRFGKEEGRARNGGFRECKVFGIQDERTHLTSLPYRMYTALGIKGSGEIAIYLDRLNQQNRDAFTRKIEDISHEWANTTEEISQPQYESLLKARAALSFQNKSSVLLSDLTILPDISFKWIGTLIKLAGDSATTHHQEVSVDDLLKKKAALARSKTKYI